MKRIIISYSHKDKEWKDRLLTQLNVLALEGYYDVWEDRRIKMGDDWLPEIESALNDAHVAILMVSANFLTSNFIRKTEVPKIMERRENEGLTVIPVIVKPCAWKRVPWLSTIQAFPEDGKPLTTFKKNQAEEKLLMTDESTNSKNTNKKKLKISTKFYEEELQNLQIELK